MVMNLRPEEPAATGWHAMGIEDLAAGLLRLAGDHPGRPSVIAINGRSGSGKSTLARRLAQHIPGSALIATDDLCWWEPMFDWADIPREQILEPLHRGEPVSFQPRAWAERGREGLIEVPPGTRVLIMEGVGADQRPFAHLIDATVWVQADYAEAERRGIARDTEDGTNGDAEESIAFWHEWQRDEIAFYSDDLPWERADLMVAGTPTIDLAEGQVAVATP